MSASLLLADQKSMFPAPQGLLRPPSIRQITTRDLTDQLAKYKIRMETEKTDQEAFRAAVVEDKKKGVSRKSPYTLGLKDQVVVLTRRQFQRRLQDKFQIYTSFSFMTVSEFSFSDAFCSDIDVDN
jgi:ATP-binding cassette subfamily G (WHITE) protein 2 (SNQ2)